MLTAESREQMIEQQVRAWDVLDERVLNIFRKVPREQFAPEQRALPRLRRRGDPSATRSAHVAPECCRTSVAGP